MGRVRERPGGPARWGVIALLLGGVALAVAAGGGAAPDEATWTGIPSAGTVVLVIVAVLGVLGLALLLLGISPGVQARRPTDRRRSWGLLLVTVVAIGVLYVVEPPQLEELTDLETTTTAPPVTVGGGAGGGRELAPVADAFTPISIGAVALILLASLAALWWLRSRAEDDLDPAGDGDDDHVLGPAIAEATERLLAVDDPRAAVLLAYRRLEEALEALDLPRAPAETPTEHLARCLDGTGTAGTDRTGGAGGGLDPERRLDRAPLLDLAGLYERARFSAHPITAADRERAADDLRRARVGLSGMRP